MFEKFTLIQTCYVDYLHLRIAIYLNSKPKKTLKIVIQKKLNQIQKLPTFLN